MLHLDSSVTELPGIGRTRKNALARLGIRNCRDLLNFFPRTYDDRTVCRQISELTEGESACVCAVVAGDPVLINMRRGLDMVKLKAVDSGGTLDITYFNQSYVRNLLHTGDSCVFYGKVSFTGRRPCMTNPVFEKEEQAGKTTGCIVPVYRLTAGLSQKILSGCVKTALRECSGETEDCLPPAVRDKYSLAGVRFAYENIHSPSDFASLAAARRRFIFEELFVLTCALGMVRKKRENAAAAVIARPDFNEFYSSLPFKPTSAQLRTVDEAAADMSSGSLMNRLIQGDVGSGKTMVAAACIWSAWKSGKQSAFMAPTEILAGQHLTTLTGFLSGFGIKVDKLTGSMKAAQKREVLRSLASGETDVVIGTHALLSDPVEFRSLGLVVTDEQHRFGVDQRAALAAKGGRPHTLVMSATPIPRTLALFIYGDLDVSVIDELPPGRQKVDTFAVDESYRKRINAFIAKLVSQGRQVFVVCPKIEESEDESPGTLKSAEEHAETLRREFPNLRVGCVHGRMKSREKDEVMASFISGGTDILVSTTVIEVGVDIPNAALMIIENAERFGLSQLHQLRGRVGRGSSKSYCVLISDSKGEEAAARLKIMTRTSDGFRISEEDLRIRGPGDFFGSRQHGLPEMHIADLGADMNILKAAQTEASKLLASDPGLNSPENILLRDRAKALLASADGRLN